MPTGSIVMSASNNWRTPPSSHLNGRLRAPSTDLVNNNNNNNENERTSISSSPPAVIFRSLSPVVSENSDIGFSRPPPPTNQSTNSPRTTPEPTPAQEPFQSHEPKLARPSPPSSLSNNNNLQTDQNSNQTDSVPPTQAPRPLNDKRTKFNKPPPPTSLQNNHPLNLNLNELDQAFPVSRSTTPGDRQLQTSAKYSTRVPDSSKSLKFQDCTENIPLNVPEREEITDSDFFSRPRPRPRSSRSGTSQSTNAYTSPVHDHNSRVRQEPPNTPPESVFEPNSSDKFSKNPTYDWPKQLQSNSRQSNSQSETLPISPKTRTLSPSSANNSPRRSEKIISPSTTCNTEDSPQKLCPKPPASSPPQPTPSNSLADTGVAQPQPERTNRTDSRPLPSSTRSDSPIKSNLSKTQPTASSLNDSTNEPVFTKPRPPFKPDRASDTPDALKILKPSPPISGPRDSNDSKATRQSVPQNSTVLQNSTVPENTTVTQNSAVPENSTVPAAVSIETEVKRDSSRSAVNKTHDEKAIKPISSDDVKVSQNDTSLKSPTSSNRQSDTSPSQQDLPADRSKPISDGIQRDTSAVGPGPVRISQNTNLVESPGSAGVDVTTVSDASRTQTRETNGLPKVDKPTKDVVSTTPVTLSDFKGKPNADTPTNNLTSFPSAPSADADQDRPLTTTLIPVNQSVTLPARFSDDRQRSGLKSTRGTNSTPQPTKIQTLPAGKQKQAEVQVPLAEKNKPVEVQLTNQPREVENQTLPASRQRPTETLPLPADKNKSVADSKDRKSPNSSPATATLLATSSNMEDSQLSPTRSASRPPPVKPRPSSGHQRPPPPSNRSVSPPGGENSESPPPPYAGVDQPPDSEPARRPPASNRAQVASRASSRATASSRMSSMDTDTAQLLPGSIPSPPVSPERHPPANSKSEPPAGDSKKPVPPSSAKPGSGAGKGDMGGGFNNGVAGVDDVSFVKRSAFEKPQPPSSKRMSISTIRPDGDLGYERSLPPTSTFGSHPIKSNLLASLNEEMPPGGGKIGLPIRPMSGMSGNTGNKEENENSWATMLYDFTQDTSLHGINMVTKPSKFLIRRLTPVAANGWYGMIESLYATNSSAGSRPCINGTEFQCAASLACISVSLVCDMFPDCSDASDETNCDPCPLLTINSPGGYMIPTALAPLLNQYYELQPNTYNTGLLPVYYNRNNMTTTPWLFYNSGLGQWQMAGAYLGTPVAANVSSSAVTPQHVNGSTWTFIIAGVTYLVPNVAITCTYDFSQLLVSSPINENASIGLNLSTLYSMAAHRQSDMVQSCQWKGVACQSTDVTTHYTDMGMCFTFNSSDMFVENSGPGSGLSFTANIEQYEYTKSTDQGVGLKLLMHDIDDSAQMATKGTAVSPGLHSYISVETTQVTNMPPPFGSCGATPLKYFTTYTMSNCLLECQTDYIYGQCGCIDVYMPNGNGAMAYCDLFHYVNCLTPKLDQMQAAGNYCTCPTPCATNTYVPTASFAVVLSSSDSSTANDASAFALSASLAAAQETSYRVNSIKYTATMQTIHQTTVAMERMSRFASASSGILTSDYNSVKLDATNTLADCMWIRDLLSQAKTAIQTDVLQPIVVFETTFANILNDYYILQNVMSATIAQVYSYTYWNISTDNSGLYLYISAQNATVQQIYAALTQGLSNQVTPFWNNLQTSINSVTAIPELRLDTGRITPILPLIGIHCPWCLSSTQTSILSLVQTQVLGYVGTTLKNDLNGAAANLGAVNNYVTDVWVANMSATVNWGEVNNYNGQIGAMGNSLTAVTTAIKSAVAAAQDAIAMIDDLVDFMWTQKCQIELPKLVSELDSNQLVSQSLLSVIQSYSVAQFDSIQSYTAAYNASLLTLEEFANNVPYTDITTVIPSNKVLLDSDLNDRALLVNQIRDEIHLINYIFSSQITDAYMVSHGIYWQEYGITVCNLSPPTTVTVSSGAVVPQQNFQLKPPANVMTHWQNIDNDITLVQNNLELQTNSLVAAVTSLQTYMTSFVTSNQLSSAFYDQNFLQVDLFYKELTQMMVLQQPAYTFENLLSEIGGFVGLLLGASVLTIGEIIDAFVYTAFVKYCGTKVHPVNAASDAWG